MTNLAPATSEARPADQPPPTNPTDSQAADAVAGRKAMGERGTGSEHAAAVRGPAEQATSEHGAVDAVAGRKAAGERGSGRRTRDPQARREALADATIEIIAEVGIGRTTHRAVARRAGLPLGATTYYFPTLDALIAAALQKAAVDQEADLRLWAERLQSADDLAVALVELVAEYMADRRRARIEYELCVAAARDEALRPLAEDWLNGLHALLTPHVGEDAAHHISALLDGTMLHLLVTGAPLNAPALTAAIRALSSRRL